MRNAASQATARTLPGGNPASCAALRMEWCASSETYRVEERKFSGSRSTRAATMAEKLASDPPLVSTPRAPAGKPAISQNQRITFPSSRARTGAAA